MLWRLIALLLIALPAHAGRAFEEVGWKPTAIPLLNFSSDHGTGYGLRASLFRYDGSTVPYAHTLSAQAFFTTRGKWSHRLYLDLPHWRPGQRLEVEALLEKEDFANYYGDLSDAQAEALLGAMAEATHAQRTTFKQVYPKLRLIWIRALGAPWHLRAGFQAGHNEITPNAREGSLLHLLAPLGRRGGFLLLVNAALRRDTRDDYNDSNRGLLEELLVEYGLGGGGHFNGGRLSFEHRHFLPLPAGLVLAHRAGAALAFGDLPFYEELKLGGDDTVRGLAAARERGEGRVLFNAELRWPGLSLLRRHHIRGGLILFADAGQIFRRAEGPSPDDWRLGAGAGGRFYWHSTIVRADVGRSGRRTGIYLTFSQVF